MKDLMDGNGLMTTLLFILRRKDLFMHAGLAGSTLILLWRTNFFVDRPFFDTTVDTLITYHILRNRKRDRTGSRHKETNMTNESPLVFFF